MANQELINDRKAVPCWDWPSATLGAAIEFESPGTFTPVTHDCAGDRMG